MNDLRDLLAPGESVFLLGPEPVLAEGLSYGGAVPCWQMRFPDAAPLPAPVPGVDVQPLSCADAVEMVELIQVAYPGYFRSETCRMGNYFGVRDASGTLVAMGGERLVADPFREISGLCSHPSQAGRQLGTAVLRRVLEDQRSRGAIPWLWVTQSNTRAVRLYERLGFEHLRASILHRVTRVG